MALTTAAAHALALLYFNNTSHANVGDATGIVGSTAPGSFYGSLHTADPGVGGNQTTSEAAYTGYGTRPGVARSSAGWTVGTGGAVTNAAVINWPACTGSTSTVTFVGWGSAATTAGNLLTSGAQSPSLSISNGITPTAAIGAIAITVT